MVRQNARQLAPFAMGEALHPAIMAHPQSGANTQQHKTYQKGEQYPRLVDGILDHAATPRRITTVCNGRTSAGLRPLVRISHPTIIAAAYRSSAVDTGRISQFEMTFRSQDSQHEDHQQDGDDKNCQRIFDNELNHESLRCGKYL